MAKSADELFLQQALELARQGVGLASPNPCVGAVIVDERGRIVGRGFHTYEGRKHAEVLAMEEAGAQARGNTLYLNLEPCSHVGRTGPCADAVVAAGIARVVCSMVDPNPAVAGRGFERLRAAGIEVEVGLLEREARKLNESFAKYIRTGKPLVTLKNSMSLDARITHPAKQPGVLSYISGAATLAKVHEMRHAADAILVGVGTVLGDNPTLTDRSGLARRRALQRVVLDSQLRIPLESNLVSTANDDLIVFACGDESAKKRELEARGVRVEIVPTHDGHTDLDAVLRRLGELQILNVLVEGGSRINAAMLAAGAADKLWLFVSPKIFGDGAPLLTPTAMNKPIELLDVTRHQVGEEIAIEGYIRDVYA